jgi:thiol-disulfide isomerase/thioredoxin
VVYVCLLQGLADQGCLKASVNMTTKGSENRLLATLILFTMKIGLLMLLVVGFLDANGQVVKGTVEGNSIRQFFIFEPFQYSSNPFGTPTRIQVQSNGEFFYQSKLQHRGFYKIDFSGFSKYYWLSPTDTLILKVDLKRQFVLVEGSASERNSVYNEVNRISVAKGKSLEKMFEIKSNVKMAEKRYENPLFQKFLGNGVAQYRRDVEAANARITQLKPKNREDSIFIEVAKKSIATQYLCMYLVNTSYSLHRYPKSAAKIKKLQGELLGFFNPNDTALLYNKPAWMLVASEFLKQEAAKRRWNLQDSVWIDFDKFRKYAYLLPPVAQENFVGQAILTGNAVGVEGALLQRRFNAFKKRFPNSAFVGEIEKSLNPNSAGTTSSDTAIQFLNLAPSTSLKVLTNTLGSNKKLLVFWATWCSACKREMLFSSELFDELSKRKIDLVYVSFDAAAAASKWRSTVRDYGLKGFHLRVDSSSFVGNELKELAFLDKSIQLPSFLLLDCNGELLSSSLPRPSELQKLMEAVDRFANR